jgi:hypothetical protein
LKRSLLIGLPAVVLVAFAAASAYLIFGQGKPPSQPTNFHLTATTQRYSVVLGVAPMQNMYTPDQVKTQHPTDGEVMFSGRMVMPPGGGDGHSMPGMSMPPSAPPGWRHLEVHIYDRPSDHVVNDANPVITVLDTRTGKETNVPIVTMQGITAGPSDFHYGNNVFLPSGDSYKATVRVGADTATFQFKL